MNDKIDNDSKIDTLRALLADLTTGWRPDRCSPPNYERRTGDDKLVAIVDVRCGGFQWSHWPKVVGWRVSLPGSSSVAYDLIIVDYSGVEGGLESGSSEDKCAAAAVAIEAAKKAADEALADHRKGKS
jgi:hypothetical protein